MKKTASSPLGQEVLVSVVAMKLFLKLYLSYLLCKTWHVFVLRRSRVILAASSGEMIQRNRYSTLLRFMSVWVCSLPVAYFKMTKMVVDVHNYTYTCV